MNVIVCMKQLPDSTNVRINPKTNTLMREGVESIVNPFDEYALEQALVLKDRVGAKVTVVSMGPPQATAVLKASGGQNPDLVLFGKQAIDGDTAQVGPGVSEFLDLPLVTYVKALEVKVEGQGLQRTAESSAVQPSTSNLRIGASTSRTASTARRAR